MLSGISPEVLQTIVAYGPIALMGLIFYFVLYRPQKREQDKRTEMLSNLKKGDRIITTGGMYGTITSLDSQKITLKVAEKIEMDFLRNAVQSYQNPQKKN